MVLFLLIQVDLVPELPQTITGKIKGVNFNKCSLVRCHCQQTQNPLLSVILGKSLLFWFSHCGMHMLKELIGKGTGPQAFQHLY